MQTNISSPKQWLREIDVEVEPQRLTSRFEEMLDGYRDRAEIPGFRPGRVPRNVLARRLGSALEGAAVEEIVKDSLAELLQRDDIRPAAEPRITDLEVKRDKTIFFRVRLEVFPEFELKDYRGMKLRKTEPGGFDEEFEKRLQALREKCATFRAVPRPAGEHDFVVVDYRITEGDADAGEPRTGVLLEVGDPMNYEAVNAALKEARPGTEVSPEVEIPADHGDKSLAGRKVTYHFTVKEVKEKLLPDIDEEFAQDLGFDDMDALRRDINDQIAADRARLVENGLKNQVFDRLVGSHDFEPPDAWVQASFQRLRTEYRLPDDEETRKKLMAIAGKWARFDVIVSRIARDEKISVSEEEVRQQIEELARSSGRKADEIAPLLDNPSYRSQLLREKVIALVLKHAEIE